MNMANSQRLDGNQQEGCSLDRPLKDGERLLAPSRRPDGTMRKPIRIRAGYTPQDEVAIYQSKGAQIRRGLPQVPPGYDPEEDGPLQQLKTKSSKKNQRRKEKRHQADTASFAHSGEAAERSLSDDKCDPGSQESNLEGVVDAVTDQMNSISISGESVEREEKDSNEQTATLEKRIRALKKKIRSIESLQDKATLNSEQLEKLSRLEFWKKELSDLETERRAF